MLTVLTFSTTEHFAGPGVRVSLTPKGAAIAAPAGNAGIGHTLGNSAGGKVIVQLLGPAHIALIERNTPAGVALYDAANGYLSATAPSSGRPRAAISLEPTGEDDARLYVLRESAAQPASPAPAPSPNTSARAFVTPPTVAGPASARPVASFTPPATAGPGTTMSHSKAIAEFHRLRSEYCDRGLSPAAALDATLTNHPALAADYAKAVRASPGALDQGAAVEARRLIDEAVADGTPRAKAASNLFARRPDLKSALVKNSTPQQQAGRDKPACAVEVERRVEVLKAKGKSHAQAVCEVFAADPALHAQYRAAYERQS